MKSGIKTVRNLMIPIIILVLLVFGLIVANLFLPEKVPIPDQTEQPLNTEVVSISIDDILFVSVAKSEGEGYKIVRETIGTAANQWSYEDMTDQYSKDCFSKELLELYIREVSSIGSSKSIDVDNTQLSDYGLEKPTAEVTYVLNSGEEVRVQIGSKTADGKSKYLRVDSMGPVYIVPVEKTELFDATAKVFFDRRVLDYSARSISDFHFSRPADDLVVSAKPEVFVSPVGDTSSWLITQPIEFRSGKIFDQLAASVLTLVIDEYVTDSNVNLAEYGLETPEYEFTIEEPDGRVTHAYFSREMSGKHYGYTDRIPGIFKISSDRISGLDDPLVEYYFPFPVQAVISEVKSIKAVFPEEEFLVEMNITEGMTLEDPEASVLVNRRSAKVTDSNNTSYFMVLFVSVMEIRFEKVTEETVSVDDIDISIQIVRKNNQVTTIDLSPQGDDLFALSLDGKFTGFLVSSDEIYSRKITEPGVWYAYELLNQALDGQINGKYDVPVP